MTEKKLTDSERKEIIKQVQSSGKTRLNALRYAIQLVEELKEKKTIEKKSCKKCGTILREDKNYTYEHFRFYCHKCNEHMSILGTNM